MWYFGEIANSDLKKMHKLKTNKFISYEVVTTVKVYLQWHLRGVSLDLAIYFFLYLLI